MTPLAVGGAHGGGAFPGKDPTKVGWSAPPDGQAPPEGFKDQIYDMFKTVPPNIQVSLLSATVAPEILDRAWWGA